MAAIQCVDQMAQKVKQEDPAVEALVVEAY
jgi:hypothetical protein